MEERAWPSTSSVFSTWKVRYRRRRTSRIRASLDSLNQEIQDRGAWVFAGGLHPPGNATVIRSQGDDLLITDGAFAESKEYMGGFTVIEAGRL